VKTNSLKKALTCEYSQVTINFTEFLFT